VQHSASLEALNLQQHTLQDRLGAVSAVCKGGLLSALVVRVCCY
jgi:hypothetical protein